MSRSFALTQKVNFYVSVAFILAFGIFMTVTVLNAVNSADFKYLTASAALTQ